MQSLLTGVILAPGRRAVSTALYVLGLQKRGDFSLFHHVLSRASWSSLAVSRVLLDQLVRHLIPTGPLLFAIDEILERHWGEKIEALGVYRDPVRSSHGHFVKDKGMRWVSLMLRAELLWARPLLTVLARPSGTTRPAATATRRSRQGLPDAVPPAPLAPRPGAGGGRGTAPTPPCACWPSAKA